MSPTEGAEVLARTVGGLAVVLGLLWAAVRVARSRLSAGPRRDAVQLVHRVGVGRRTSLAVVRVADRSLLLGVGDSGVTLLADLPGGTPAAPGPEHAPTASASAPASSSASPAPAPRRTPAPASVPPRGAVPVQRALVRPRPTGVRGAIARAQDRTVRR